MHELVNEILLKYFDQNNIENINVFENKIIITLKNTAEIKTTDIEQEIKEKTKKEKVIVVFTKEKETTSLNNAEDNWKIPNVKKIIAVASGKGGVGKSTTAVNLALALQSLGLKVGLFDADIYGPSIPIMLGYKEKGVTSYDGETIQPFYFSKIKSMSIGSIIEDETPLIWRGAKACGAIEQLLTQTDWGELDVLLIDMPPGTGDIQISIAQKINLNGVIIVSTPQDVALADVIRGINMFKKLDVPIIGIIENMSYYICEHCGEKAYIFGQQGAKNIANQIGERFLGEIPLHIDIRQNSDFGKPIVLTDPEGFFAKIYKEIAKKIAEVLNL